MKFLRNMNMGVTAVSFFPEFTFISYFQKKKLCVGFIDQFWVGVVRVYSDKSYL